MSDSTPSKTNQSDLFANAAPENTAVAAVQPASDSQEDTQEKGVSAKEAGAPKAQHAASASILDAPHKKPKTGLKREVYIAPKASRFNRPKREEMADEEGAQDRPEAPLRKGATQKRASLLKKRAARLAAVQALYGASFENIPPAPHKMAAQITGQWQDSKKDRDGLLPTDTMPENALLVRILEGVALYRNAIDGAIDAHILTGWTRQRMGGVLVAVLQAAAAEWLISTRALPVLVDEYASVGETMLGEEELSYLHKVLHLVCESLPRDAAQ